MEIYLSFQTLILIIAAAFILYGQYQSDDYIVKRKHDLFQGIGQSIILIFVVDLFTVFIIKCLIQHNIQ